MQNYVQMQAALTTSSDPNLAQLNALTAGVQSLVSAYTAVLTHCNNQVY